MHPGMAYSRNVASSKGSTVREYRRVVLDGAIQVVEAHDDGQLTARDGRTVDAEDAIHLPPCQPSKVIAVHFNTESRHIEMARDIESAPTYFAKLPSSLVGHRGNVIRPSGCSYLNYEGELALVVGSIARNVSVEDAAAYVGGYTVANDFGIHDFRDTDWGSMLRVKSSDTMLPLGPGIVTGWDPGNKYMRTEVNGELRQEGSTKELLWPPEYLLADLSRHITLYPGDVILCGTPANSRPVAPGDVVTVEIEGLGQIVNPIVEGTIALPTDYGAQPTATENVLSVALGNSYVRPG